MDNAKLTERYGASEHGNFAVTDLIGVPHAYCVTEKHVAYASDHCGGRLNEDTIDMAERHGAHCGMRGCKLTYKAHEQALLVSCKVALADDDGMAIPELHEYLVKSKPLCEEDKYAGFAFLDKREEQ